MSFDNLMSGFVGAALVGVLTLLGQKLLDRRKSLEERSFQIYMMLMDLNSYHFWIVSAETLGKTAKPEQVLRFHKMRWQISDELRKADDLPELEELVRTMLSLEFAKENDRSKVLEQILDKLGGRINPRYQKAMREVIKQNDRMMEKDPDEFFRRQSKVEAI